MNKGIVAIIVLILVIVVGVGAWMAMQPAQTSSANNNTNKIVKNQTNNNTNVTISAEKAKELATQYTGMGVTLGTPTLTTYKGVEVWQVPVYTAGQNLTVDSIYIDANTGKRIQKRENISFFNFFSQISN
jgi:uncharacterized membrane protein YkoI